MSDAKNPLEDLNQQAMLSQQGGHGGAQVALNEIFGRKSEDAKKVMGWEANTKGWAGGESEDHSGGGSSGGGGSGGDWSGGHADHHEGPIYQPGSYAAGNLTPSSSPSVGGGGGEREV